MPRTEENKCKPTSSQMGNSKAQRPQSLLRRLSSGIFSMVPSFSAGRSIPKQNATQRSRTAPNLHRTLIQKQEEVGDPIVSSNRQGFLPTIAIPTLSDTNQPCPYDSSTYHSFPSIEESKCTFCGLRRPSSTTSGFHSKNQPCSNCRSKSPFSHLAFGGKRSRVGRRSGTAQSNPVSSRTRYSSSPDLSPRPVPALIAAKRIGNPPRKARLPVPRIPVLSEYPPASTIPTAFAVRPAKGVIGFTKIPVFWPGHGDIKYDGSRPISPKLHHIHVLPHASDYPYVHRNEVEQHLAALQAGVPSPLETIIDKSHATGIPGVPDYAETVYYGPTSSLDSTSSSPQSQRPQLTRSKSTASSISTSSTPRVGGRRLELRGGRGHYHEIPRLRGGCGEKHTPHTNCFIFKLKTWLLTGTWRSYDHEADSDTDLPPARTPNPTRVARAAHRSCRRVPLPHSISKNSFPTPQRRLSPNPSQTSTKDTTPLATSPPHTPTLLSCTPPIPHLRGGAGAPRPLLDTDRLPSLLYFLAGGKRRPVTVSSWKKERPKRRTGGFLGLVMYGRYAGVEYGCGGAGRKGGGGGVEGSEVREGQMRVERGAAGGDVEVGVAAEVRVAVGSGAAAGNGARAASQGSIAPVAPPVTGGEARAGGGAASQGDW